MEVTEKSANGYRLPPGWKQAMSRTRWPGKFYYFNVFTGERRWEKPNMLVRSKSLDIITTSHTGTTLSGDYIENEEDVGTVCKKCGRSKEHDPDVVIQAVITENLQHSVNRNNLACGCDLKDRLVQFLNDLVSFSTLSGPSGPSLPIAGRNFGIRTRNRSFSGMSVMKFIKGKIHRAKVLSERRNVSIATFQGMRVPSFGTPEMNFEDSEVSRIFAQRVIDSFDINEAAVPSLSLAEYVDRIWRYSYLSDSTMVVAALYIARLVIKRRLSLSERNVYKMYLAAVMVAAKNCEDSNNLISNRSFSRIGGVNLNELNSLEIHFLNLQGWKLYVTAEMWAKAVEQLKAVGVSL